MTFTLFEQYEQNNLLRKHWDQLRYSNKKFSLEDIVEIYNIHKHFIFSDRDDIVDYGLYVDLVYQMLVNFRNYVYPTEMYEELVKIKHWKTQWGVAYNLGTPLEVLSYLKEHGIDYDTRTQASQNLNSKLSAEVKQ